MKMRMSLSKDYWENRYQTGQTGWDAGGITTPMKDYIDQLASKEIKILLPGAGNGYEFEYLVNSGFSEVYVADFAASPLKNIAERMPRVSSDRLICADFFDLEGTYDLILEQTFFCALDPGLRKAYVEKVSGLLKPGGKLAGLLFQFPLTDQGPPFGGGAEEYRALFETDFHIRKMETAYNSIPPRAGNELFIIFEKK